MSGISNLNINSNQYALPVFGDVKFIFREQQRNFFKCRKNNPHEFNLRKLQKCISSNSPERLFFNSLIVASVTTVGQVIFAALAGYAFARMKFRYKNALFLIILITMLIPPQVNIIPLFFLMRELHLIDTYQALILPALFGGFGVFLMRQYFLGLPKDLEESAKIDGCNLFQTFFKIALPLALPTVATLAIFTFVTTWNSFMWPLIVTNSEAMRTLPVGLAIYKGSFRK
ncbi:MAG: carbohydrate ABC transporter permease [Candidatus Gastranaerophilaceae bacterium]